MRSALVKGCLLLALICVAAQVPAWAQDPAKVAPESYKCIFENERVRVCEVTVKPGASVATHSHPDHFVYVIAGGTGKITPEGGEAQPIEFKAGQVTWMKAVTHSAVNTGTTELRLLVTELKPPAK